MCPLGDGGDASGQRKPRDWRCLRCGHECVAAQVGVFIAAEEALAQSLDGADDLGEPRPPAQGEASVACAPLHRIGEPR